MSHDTIRLLVTAEIIVIVTCGLAIHLAHRDVIPQIIWWAGWGFGWVIASAAAALALNVIAGEPLTVGGRLLAVAIAPAAVWVLGFTIAALRVEQRARRRDVAVRDLAAHLDVDPACGHPECRQIRAELRRLTEGAP